MRRTCRSYERNLSLIFFGIMVCSSLHTQGSNFRFSRKVNGRSLSPLARGTRKMSGIVERNKRFIPACAGNSTVKASKVSIVAVHPRLRGELYIPVRILRRFFGSSPLARGTLIRLAILPDDPRFIPACAGNSENPKVVISWSSVHPRLRGELLLIG